MEELKIVIGIISVFALALVVMWTWYKVLDYRESKRMWEEFHIRMREKDKVFKEKLFKAFEHATYQLMIENAVFCEIIVKSNLKK